MKKCILIGCLAICVHAYAQRAATNFILRDQGKFITTDDMSARAGDFVDKNALKNGRMGHAEGSVFLHSRWDTGYVQLQNGTVVPKLPLRYNVYSDQLYYLTDSVELVIQDLVPEFGYAYTSETGETKSILFRSGYPPIGNNSNNSFYEVLVDGDISLLKKYSKHLRQQGLATGIISYKIEDTEAWYGYSKSRNTIIRIKKNAGTLMGLLGAVSSNKADELIKSDNLKLNTEKDLIRLFEMLNGGGFK